jgi:hypothetical protein
VYEWDGRKKLYHLASKQLKLTHELYIVENAIHVHSLSCSPSQIWFILSKLHGTLRDVTLEPTLFSLLLFHLSSSLSKSRRSARVKCMYVIKKIQRKSPWKCLYVRKVNKDRAKKILKYLHGMISDINIVSKKCAR